MLVRAAADVGRLIREARVRNGLSQATLAHRFGTTQSWISEVENGKETAEIGKVLHVLASLGLELDLSDPRDARREPRHAGFEDYPNIDEIVDRGEPHP